MKILLMIPNLAGGGAEKVLVNLCNALAEQTQLEIDVSVMLLFDEGVNRDALSDKVNCIHCFDKRIPGLRFLLKLVSPEKLAKKYICAEYDLVISYLEGTMTRIASGYAGKKVAWIHSTIMQDDIKAHFASMQEAAACYQRFDRIVAVSNEVRENFQQLFPCVPPERVTVLHNLLETDEIKRQAEEQVDGFKSTAVNAVVVGKLTESKGVFRIVEALSTFRDDLKKLHVFFAGAGPDRDKLQDVIKKRNLESQVTMVGYQKNPYKWICHADMLICPSYAEGLSTAVTEALILGVPVLATNCGGMPELLGNSEYGLIVSNTDRALAEGMIRMVNDRELREHYRKQSARRGKDFLKSQILNETTLFLNETVAGE